MGYRPKKLTYFAPWGFSSFADGQEEEEPRNVITQRRVVEAGEAEDGESQ